MTEWIFYALGVALALYALIVLAFVVGTPEDARALAGFVPDCVVLFARLVRDDRLARRHKILVAGLIPYLALPFDLVPDFIPVAGVLDDAVIVIVVLRHLVRRDPALLVEHWPGPSIVACASAATRWHLGSGRCPVTVTFVVVSES